MQCRWIQCRRGRTSLCFGPGWRCGQKAAGGQSITQSCSDHSNVNEPALSQNVLMWTTIIPTGWNFHFKYPTFNKQRRFKLISQSLPLSYSSQTLFLNKRPQSHRQPDQHFLCFRDKSPDLWMEGDNTFIRPPVGSASMYICESLCIFL